jgi:hypothetical protein
MDMLHELLYFSPVSPDSSETYSIFGLGSRSVAMSKKFLGHPAPKTI